MIHRRLQCTARFLAIVATCTASTYAQSPASDDLIKLTTLQVLASAAASIYSDEMAYNGLHGLLPRTLLISSAFDLQLRPIDRPSNPREDAPQSAFLAAPRLRSRCGRRHRDHVLHSRRDRVRA